VPAIYYDRVYPANGGLMSYGASLVGMFGKLATMSAEFSKARNRRTCQFYSRPGLSWSST
jgi:hypothetical protein